MPRRLAQQRMTLSDLEWPFHASRCISALGELLVMWFLPERDYVTFGSLLSQFRLSVCLTSVCRLSSVCRL